MGLFGTPFKKRGRFDGPVTFFEGAHYPDGKHGQKRHKLIWIANGDSGHYEFWDGQGASHQARYHRRDVDIVPGDG